MKTCMRSFADTNNFGKSLTMLLSFLLLCSFSSAQTAEVTAGREKPAIVKHVTTLEDKIYFQVQLNNDSTEKFVITIKDSDGAVLFRETYQEKSFDKKFLFNKEQMSKSLTFTIRKLTDNQTQTFEINYNTRLTEDVDITRLK